MSGTAGADNNSRALPSKSSKVPRKVAVEAILSQVVARNDWEVCCAELMSAYGITKDEVGTELKRRADVISGTGLLAFLVALMFLHNMQRDIHNPFLLFIGCGVFSVMDCARLLFLQHCHKSGIFLRRQTAYAIGLIGVPIATGLLTAFACFLTGSSLLILFKLAIPISAMFLLPLIPLALLRPKVEKFLSVPQPKRLSGDQRADSSSSQK